MSPRTTVLAAAILLAGVAPAAIAAGPRPSCNILSDRDDSMAETRNPSLNILSGDFASDGRVLTGVLRLATAPEEITRRTGARFDLMFVVGPDHFMFGAARMADGDHAALYRHRNAGAAGYDVLVGERIGTPTVVFDTARSEVRWTAPLAVFGGAVKPGTVLESLRATTGPAYGSAAAGDAIVELTGDHADRWVPYVVGRPSCVRPGA